MKTRYGIFRSGIYVTPKQLAESKKKVDVERYRTALHSKSNPKNLFLFSEFLEDLNPIGLEQWSTSGKLWRLKLICTAPVLLFLRLTIPRVDYAQAKHGWSKLLNCLQIVIGPFIVTMIAETMHYSTHNNSWMIVFYFNKALWSFVITVPLAAFLFHNSRTDIPPRFHQLFVIQTICTVIVYVWACCWEMEVIILLIGCVFKLSSNYLAITFNAISNEVPDIIAYVNLSKGGYGKMAFGGIIGGAVFNLVGNMGTQFAKAQEEYMHLVGDFGETLYIFLMLTICSTMGMCCILDFNARRSGGIFLWCLYVLFFLYLSLMESRLIHDFTDDQVIET